MNGDSKNNSQMELMNSNSSISDFKPEDQNEKNNSDTIIHGLQSKENRKIPESDERNKNSYFSMKKNAITAKLQAKTKYFVYMVLHVILLGYFCWATQHFLSKDYELSSTTCSGYGFLMILYILIYFTVFYYLVLKPSVFIPFLQKPFSSAFKTISSVKHIGPLTHGIVLFGCIVFIVYDSWGSYLRLFPFVGLVCFFLFGFVLSSDKKKINWDIVIAGLDLQFIFGIFAIRWEVGKNILVCIGDKATIFLSYANNGSSFVYGEQLIYTQSVFAFQALSTILFVGMIVNILHHYGILQKFIVVLGEFLKFFMGTTICESVNSAANILLGQSESPLMLQHYLEQLTDSEIHAIMTSGFATVSGSVLAAYISFGATAADIITASVMSAPAALCFSKIIYPETGKTLATTNTIALSKSPYTSALDAACKGASTGMQLIIGIIANLISFIAFVAFLSGLLEWFGGLVGYTSYDDSWAVYRIIGYVFMPVSYVMGIPWDESYYVGRLIGIKTILNEFAAFREFSTMSTVLSKRTKVIATYAICGFANPGSIGITVSALSGLAPGKRDTILRLVYRAFVSGTVVCLMTGCIAGMLTRDESL